MEEGEGPTEPLTPDTVPLPEPLPPPPPPPAVPASPFSTTRYHFTSGLRSGETAHIRDDAGKVLLSYRSFASVIGVIATLITSVMLIAGVAGTLFLIHEKSPLRAIVALVLTISFALLITHLVPRTNTTLFDDGNPALTITQRASATYLVSLPNGTLLGQLKKSPFSFLGRTRWTVAQSGRVLAEAVEESFGRALLRKLYGKFSRRFETDLFIRLPGIEMGKIIRRTNGTGEADVLELTGDALDRRMAVALATVVFGREP